VLCVLQDDTDAIAANDEVSAGDPLDAESHEEIPEHDVRGCVRCDIDVFSAPAVDIFQTYWRVFHQKKRNENTCLCVIF